MRVWSVVAANDSGRMQQDGGNVSADASAAGFKFLELRKAAPSSQRSDNWDESNPFINFVSFF